MNPLAESRSGVAVIHAERSIIAAVAYLLEGAVAYGFVTGRSTSFKEHNADGSYSITSPTRPTGSTEFVKIKTTSLDDRIPLGSWRRGNIALGWGVYYRLGNRILDDPD